MIYPGLIVKSKLREFAFTQTVRPLWLPRKFLINTPRCSRKLRPLRRKWHQRVAARVERKRSKGRRSAVTWYRRATGGYCSRSAHTKKSRIRRFAKHTVRFVINFREATLSLSILSPALPASGPSGTFNAPKGDFLSRRDVFLRSRR